MVTRDVVVDKAVNEIVAFAAKRRQQATTHHEVCVMCDVVEQGLINHKLIY
jgi:hypothetical protein